MALDQYKHLVVVVDYFTKWIEAKPLIAITSLKVQTFTFKNVISRFGIPVEIITDNETQFAGGEFHKMIDCFKIKQRFAGVEHSQTNGQAEAANKIILNRI
jgi:transposase InsO family protein